jgi:KaiC/GvpD/RAD55 family RecA-like ATPase
MTTDVAPNPISLPYQEILPRLLLSIKNAFLDFYSKDSDTGIDLKVLHSQINSHFIWLADEKSLKGHSSARHLFDAVRPLRPLASKSADKNSKVDFRTRISSLIYSKICSKDQRSYQNIEERRPRMPSILNIALEYLTIPNLPASRAYALMTLKYFLFSELKYFPQNIFLKSGHGGQPFGAKQIRDDILAIETYLRPRFESQGADFIPPTKDSSIVTKHYLAMLGVLDWKFETSDGLIRYLDSSNILPSGPVTVVEGGRSMRLKAHFEFARAGGLEKLPDAEEIVNGIIGLPLPIRGADTIFRGGLRFPAEGGLVMAVSGAAGSGKTALSLAIGASLAPFGINTLFLSAEEKPADLVSRAESLIADDISRLSFHVQRRGAWLKIDPINRELPQAEELFRQLAQRLSADPPSPENVGVLRSPCNAVVVLDGLHDRLSDPGRVDGIDKLRSFVETCRTMNALVILTTGTHSDARQKLDYLVDISVHLRQESSGGSMSRPERYMDLVKARHQFCSIGTHCMQVSGSKGFRFTPQANYQIDRQSIYSTVLHTKDKFKLPFSNFCEIKALELKEGNISSKKIRKKFTSFDGEVSKKDFRIFKDSNIFINGEGSSNKAAFALKLALAPTYNDDGKIDSWSERILVVSFLYPDSYYRQKMRDVVRADQFERNVKSKMRLPQLSVIQLYPGTIGPDTLFNKIVWEIEAAELMGCPFTSILIDGIHNVFLQFPRIETHGLFWPQLYSVLRTRKINIITTHTVLNLGIENERDRNFKIDDHKSDPLRQALVQKTDFRFEIDPESGTKHRWKFKLDILSAIDQPVPESGNLFWSREHLVFYREPEETTLEKKDRENETVADTSSEPSEGQTLQ